MKRTKAQNDEALIAEIAETLFAFGNHQNAIAARKLAAEIVKKIRVCGWKPQ